MKSALTMSVVLLLGVMCVGACMSNEVVDLGEIAVPVRSPNEFVVEIKHAGMYGLYLEMVEATPIPQSILNYCEPLRRNDPLCLVHALNGDMPWKVINKQNMAVIAQGDFRSISNLHPKITPLGRFRLEPGSYTIVFEVSNGFAPDAPLRRKAAYLQKRG